MLGKKEILSILQQGGEIWNRYRQEMPGLDIDLSGANLKEFNLRGTDLSGINFTSADLSKCNFESVNLKGSIFSNAKLCFSKFENSHAEYCSFNKADLYSVNCHGSEFTGSEFVEANLSSTRFNKCNIAQCDFRKAQTTGMVLDSRKDLKNIIHFLSDIQLSGILFQDELDNEFDTQFRAQLDHNPSLEVKIDGGLLTPFNLSYFLLAIEGVYNNVLYLTQTESENFDDIQRNITPYYQGVGADESLIIKRMSEGSIVIDLSTIAAFVGVLYTICKTVDIVGQQMLSFKKLQLESVLNEANVNKIEAETDKLKVENTRAMIELNSGAEIAELQRDAFTFDYKPVIKSLDVKSSIVNLHKEQLFETGVMPLQNILSKYEKMGYTVTANMKNPGLS